MGEKDQSYSRREIAELSGCALGVVHKAAQGGKFDTLNGLLGWVLVQRLKNCGFEGVVLPMLAGVEKVTQDVDRPGEEGEDEDWRKGTGAAGEEGVEGSPDGSGGEAAVGGGDVREEEAVGVVDPLSIPGVRKGVGGLVAKPRPAEPVAEPKGDPFDDPDFDPDMELEGEPRNEFEMVVFKNLYNRYGRDEQKALSGLATYREKNVKLGNKATIQQRDLYDLGLSQEDC